MLVAYFFYRRGCPFCAKVKPFVDLLAKHGFLVFYCSRDSFAQLVPAEDYRRSYSVMLPFSHFTMTHKGALPTLAFFKGFEQVATIPAYHDDYPLRLIYILQRHCTPSELLKYKPLLSDLARLARQKT